MSLQAKQIRRKSRDFGKIKKLYIEAFPKEERIPVWVLLVLAKRKDVDLLAFYDGDLFCGFAFILSAKDMIYVLHLATDSTVRSKGYGGKILEIIKEQNAPKTIALDMETITETAENYRQRIKRKKFYFQNGFTDTGYRLTDRKVVYDILCAGGNFSPVACKKLFRKISFGLSRPVVEKTDNNIGFRDSEL